MSHKEYDVESTSVLATISELLDAERRISPKQWACAWLLGECRRISNANRARTSDRGANGNESVDLHGSLGELLLFGLVRKHVDPESVELMRHRLFSSRGGAQIKGPDVQFRDGSAIVGIDVKTFDCSVNKRYFAINENKHMELQGLCIGYVGLICPRFAPRAYLTRLIPYDDVSRWERKTLRIGGSISMNLPIAAAMSDYARTSYDISSCRSGAFSEAQILELAVRSGKGSVASSLQRLLPEIQESLLCAQRVAETRLRALEGSQFFR